MKTLPKSYNAAVALASLVLAGLSPSAKAVLDLGGYTGPVTFNLRSLDNGTVYDVNQVTGNLSNGSNIATGAAALNGLNQTAAFNSEGFDTWGVFQVTSIDGTSGVVYNSSTSVFKIWGLFEATDIALQTSPTTGGGFVVNHASNGFTISMYSIPNGSNVFNIAPGAPLTQIPSSHHIAPGAFTGITNAVGGELMLSLSGHAGVLGANTIIGPNPGGLLTELLTAVDPTANTSEGTAFLDVRTSGGLIGSSNSMFDTNLKADGSDVQFQFTASQTDNWFTFQSPLNPNGTRNWLLGDPAHLQGFIIPEPTTALAGFGCVLPLLGSLLRRRRKGV